MSAHAVLTGTDAVLFGLDWVPLSGEMSEKDEVRHAVRERNAAWQVRYAGDQAVLYGFLARENQPQRLRRRDRMICASLLLATLPTVASNAIWLEIDGAQARMAVLKDGLPLPVGGFAGLLAEARERIQRIEADAGSGMTFALYGNDGATGTIPLSLDALLREADVPAATLMHVRAVSEICGKQPVQYLQAAAPAEKTGRSRGRLPESLAFPAGKRRHACQRGSGSDARRLAY